MLDAEAASDVVSGMGDKRARGTLCADVLSSLYLHQVRSNGRLAASQKKWLNALYSLD